MLDPLKAALSVGSLVRQARGKGLLIELSEDFDRFRQVNAEAARGELTPILDVCRTKIVNGFWLEGRDEAGDLVHIQAARLVDLEGASLQDHFHKQRALYCSLDLGIDPQRSDARTCQITARMFGRVCYHGEMWIAPLWRGSALGPGLIRLMMILSLIRWQPDYFIGLAIPKTSNPSFARKMGYAHFHPAAVRWMDDAGTLIRDEALVWSELEDLVRLARQEGGDNILGDGRKASQTISVGE